MIVFFRLSWRILGLIIFVAGLLLLNILMHKAHAEALPPDRERTVSWYQAHVDFMRRVLVACRNDPGHSAMRPDCVNAKHAEMAEVEAMGRARARLPVVLSPNDPRFWERHADMLPGRLLYCSRMTAQDQATQWCAAARMAAGSASR